MKPCPPVRVVISLLIILFFSALPTHAISIDIFVGKPPNLMKYVPVYYPREAAMWGMNGKGKYLLKVNPKTGEVDEVKVLKSAGISFLNEISAKALLQWRFIPGTTTQVIVPVEFYCRGLSRDIHD
jgi:TonB family protein